MVTENSFGPTGAACLTVNGKAEIQASRNNFDASPTFNITGGAHGLTYQDNTGLDIIGGGDFPIKASTF